MSADIARVLAEHPDWLFSIERQAVVCAGKACDWSQEVGPTQPAEATFRSHQAAVLAPLILRERAEAWDEGVRKAWHESGEGWNGEYPEGAVPDAFGVNPYRAAAIDPEGAKE
ncbi:hypothetical protein [Arthrobacter sp. Soil763]|uniref:hypothetical protein n=1 Tax=Arthrobacter sp. Soil763 TaxID=1736402 RepID=UPI000AD31602|nr:hypothetical protein [Arthrobacter sp. Soil763]